MIRWITDSLGTAPWESAVSVPEITVLDVRDLVDKEGNSSELIRSKIEQGLDALDAGETVVVACDYGISRSNAVAAAILAVGRCIPYYDGLQLVVDRTGEKEIKIETIHGVAAVVDLMQGRAEDEEQQSVPRIVVTGGSGYIGSALVPLLQTRFPTLAICHDEADLVAGAVELDLLVQAHAATHLVHLATPRDFGKNSAVGDSVSMVKNVLDVWSGNGLKLLFVSSADVFSGYDAMPHEATESLTPLPRSSPGVAKFLCETLIGQHSAVHGLATTVLRSATIYGGSDRRPKYLHTFIEKALRDDNITVHRYRNGHPAVDLLHIDDFCRAVIAAIERNVSGVVHCGSGVGITTRDLVDLIQSVAGSHCNVSDHRIDANTPNVILDCSLATATLGWKPQIPLGDGIQVLVNSKTIVQQL